MKILKMNLKQKLYSLESFAQDLQHILISIHLDY